MVVTFVGILALAMLTILHVSPIAMAIYLTGYYNNPSYYMLLMFALPLFLVDILLLGALVIGEEEDSCGKTS